MALVLFVKDGSAPSPLVEGKDLNPSTLNTLENVVVAANVLLEAVDDHDVRFGRRGRDVSTRIKVGVGRTDDPLFLVACHFWRGRGKRDESLDVGRLGGGRQEAVSVFGAEGSSAVRKSRNATEEDPIRSDNFILGKKRTVNLPN